MPMFKITINIDLPWIDTEDDAKIIIEDMLRESRFHFSEIENIIMKSD